jgi:hypothetical protein
MVITRGCFWIFLTAGIFLPTSELYKGHRHEIALVLKTKPRCFLNTILSSFHLRSIISSLIPLLPKLKNLIIF